MRLTAESSVRRLSLYLDFLEGFEKDGRDTVSSGELAARGGTTSAQVRKDLSRFGSFGKRGLGYSVRELASTLRAILGLDRTWRVVIVGAGKIGAALAQYAGFRARGFAVVGIFDNDPGRVGVLLDGVTVADVAALERDTRALGAEMAILAVPAEAAQGIADRLVGCGIEAILDFSSAGVTVPCPITVRNMNMASELEILSYAVTNR